MSGSQPAGWEEEWRLVTTTTSTPASILSRRLLPLHVVGFAHLSSFVPGGEDLRGLKLDAVRAVCSSRFVPRVPSSRAKPVSSALVRVRVSASNLCFKSIISTG